MKELRDMILSNIFILNLESWHHLCDLHIRRLALQHHYHIHHLHCPCSPPHPERALPTLQAQKKVGLLKNIYVYYLLLLDISITLRMWLNGVSLSWSSSPYSQTTSWSLNRPSKYKNISQPLPFSLHLCRYDLFLLLSDVLNHCSCTCSLWELSRTPPSPSTSTCSPLFLGLTPSSSFPTLLSFSVLPLHSVLCLQMMMGIWTPWLILPIAI